MCCDDDCENYEEESIDDYEENNEDICEEQDYCESKDDNIENNEENNKEESKYKDDRHLEGFYDSKGIYHEYVYDEDGNYDYSYVPSNQHNKYIRGRNISTANNTNSGIGVTLIVILVLASLVISIIFPLFLIIIGGIVAYLAYKKYKKK